MKVPYPKMNENNSAYTSVGNVLMTDNPNLIIIGNFEFFIKF